MSGTVAVQCQECGTFGTWPVEDIPIPVADLRFDLEIDPSNDGYILSMHIGRGDASRHARVYVDGRTVRDPQILMRALRGIIDQMAEYLKVNP